jgi:hypothetical protein
LIRQGILALSAGLDFNGLPKTVPNGINRLREKNRHFFQRWDTTELRTKTKKEEETEATGAKCEKKEKVRARLR